MSGAAQAASATSPLRARDLWAALGLVRFATDYGGPGSHVGAALASAARGPDYKPKWPVALVEHAAKAIN